MNTIVHFTHNDGDAVGCAVLMKYYFEYLSEYTVNNIFCSYSGIDAKFMEFFKNFDIKAIEDADYEYSFTRNEDSDSTYIYDYRDISAVYMTDISFGSDETREKFIEFVKKFKEKINSKVKFILIDHHKTNMDRQVENPYYSFDVRVENELKDSDEKLAVSATYLLFNHLTNLEDTISYNNLSMYNEYGFGDDLSWKVVNNSYSDPLELIVNPENPLKVIDMIKTFVTDVSRYDTWLWKTKFVRKNPDEHRTTMLCQSVGPAMATEIIYNTISDEIIYDTTVYDDITMGSHRQYNIEYITKDIVCVLNYHNKYSLDRVAASLDYNLKVTKLIFDDVGCSTVENKTLQIFDAMNSNRRIYSGNILRSIQMDGVKSKPNTVGLLIQKGDENFSQLSDIIEDGYPEVFDYLIMIYPGTQDLSFRTKKDNFDVSKIAKSFGGGGHTKAAGAHVSMQTITEFLLLYDKSEQAKTLRSVIKKM